MSMLMLAYVCCYVYIRWGRYVHIGVGSWVARFDYNGQFLGPQAVERVTDRVSTSFFYIGVHRVLILIDFLETAGRILSLLKEKLTYYSPSFSYLSAN